LQPANVLIHTNDISQLLLNSLRYLNRYEIGKKVGGGTSASEGGGALIQGKRSGKAKGKAKGKGKMELYYGEDFGGAGNGDLGEGGIKIGKVEQIVLKFCSDSKVVQKEVNTRREILGKIVEIEGEGMQNHQSLLVAKIENVHVAEEEFVVVMEVGERSGRGVVETS